MFAAGALLRVLFMLDYRPAFLGISDAGSYLDAAHRGLFNGAYELAGYPLFVRAAHALYPHLSLLILVQHCLGVGTAAILYLAVRRVTGSVLLGLIPAALVLFDGFELWVEHAPLTEALFTFLVASGLYLAIRAVGGRRCLLAGAGLLVAGAAIVKPVGLILVAVIGLWILSAATGPAKQRLLAVLALVGPACLLVGAYVLLQRTETGFTGLTRDSGRVLYARVAPFAQCSRFTAPAGTAALCESTRPRERGSPNQYLFGFPDHARQVSAAGRSISPAWRVFGPPPAGNSQLLRFALAVLVNQPLDYLAAIANYFHYYWTGDDRAFIVAAQQIDPSVDRVVGSYYRTGAGAHSHGLGFLRWYGESVHVAGIAMIVLLLAPLTALLAEDRRARMTAILLACAGWLLPLASDAFASVDPRYLLSSYGLLAAAAAIGLRGIQAHPKLGRALGRRGKVG